MMGEADFVRAVAGRVVFLAVSAQVRSVLQECHRVFVSSYSSRVVVFKVP